MNASAFSKKPLSQKQKKTLFKKAASANAPASIGEQDDKQKGGAAAADSKTNGVALKGSRVTDEKAGSAVSDEKKRQTQWEQTKAMSAANDNFKAGK